MKKILTMTVLILLAIQSFANSAEDFIKNYPKKWEMLKKTINADYSGLETYKKALDNKNDKVAAEALLKYLKNSKTTKNIKLSDINKVGMNVSDIGKNTYTVQGKKGTLQKRADGHVDWNFIPQSPVKCDKQFPMLVSRFGITSALINSYDKYKNKDMAKLLQYVTTDFILAQPYTMSRKSTPSPDNEFGNMKAKSKAATENYVWLTLNAGLRLSNWCPGFYLVMKYDMFDDEALLLWLSSIEEHADYLCYSGFGGGNWGTSEMLALIEAARLFPEFAKSDFWKETAVERYVANISQNIYPDGAQSELAHMYGIIVLRDTIKFLNKAKAANAKIPEKVNDMIKAQITYYAFISKPDRRVWAHGDSDSDCGIDGYKELFDKEPKNFDAQEAMYLFSQGKSGSVEEDGIASRFFPYSGSAVMLSDFGKDRQWAVFDMGPFGSAHQHPDKLAFNLYDGRELLTDPGRYSYSWDGGWSPNYFMSIVGHNTVSIDDNIQSIPNWNDKHDKLDPKLDLVSLKPIDESYVKLTKDYDQFSARTISGYRKGLRGAMLAGKAIHDRTVYYQKANRYYLIFDRIFTDKPRTIDAYWHFGPEVKEIKTASDNSVYSIDNGEKNLLIMPLVTDKISMGVKTFYGSDNPKQGWYASKMNHKQPIHALQYTGNISKNANFGWLIIPFDGVEAPKVEYKVISIKDTSATFEVTINDKTDTINIEYQR